jgi:hypothetical protein
MFSYANVTKLYGISHTQKGNRKVIDDKKNVSTFQMLEGISGDDINCIIKFLINLLNLYIKSQYSYTLMTYFTYN